MMQIALRIALALTLVFCSKAMAEQLVLSGRTAFSLARSDINSSDLAKFNYGRGLFHHVWQVVEHEDGTRSGIGPLFNSNSCAGCHIRDGRGRPPLKTDKNSGSFVVVLGTPDNQGGSAPDSTYGFQLQDQSVGIEPEAKVTVRYRYTIDKVLNIELREPIIVLSEFAFGPPNELTMYTGRIAPQLIGLGHLEAVDDDDLSALADPHDVDEDGISGRINVLADGSAGRFGWKATSPSVHFQSVKAASFDMGISTPTFPKYAGDCTSLQADCLDASLVRPQNKHTELDVNEARILANYTSNLQVPPRRYIDVPAVKSGEVLFAKAGCANCHIPDFASTESSRGAYTDLLLHDLGQGLADATLGKSEFAREWRTPPLWGIGYTEEVNGNIFYLHDGRARNLTEAILWHGGEAQVSADNFRALNSIERENLISFLKSL